jgi:hypothetical protein
MAAHYRLRIGDLDCDERHDYINLYLAADVNQGESVVETSLQATPRIVFPDSEIPFVPPVHAPDAVNAGTIVDLVCNGQLVVEQTRVMAIQCDIAEDKTDRCGAILSIPRSIYHVVRVPNESDCMFIVRADKGNGLP